MKKQILLFTTFFLIIGTIMAQEPVWPGDGEGTADLPYLIETAQHLDNVRNYLGFDHTDVHFRLENDIDLTDFLDGEANGWIPIGAAHPSQFTGTFNGNGKKITGLWLTRTLRVGLFGVTLSAYIYDLGVETNGIVAGTTDVGIIVGHNSNSTISNCYAIGDVSGTDKVGGIAGFNDFGTIQNSYAMANVTRASGSGESVAPFVGRNDRGVIKYSYSTGSATYDGTINASKGFCGTINDGSASYEMSGNFWDKQTSQATTTAGEASPKTTLEMQTHGMFLEAGWDFIGEDVNGTNNIWGINPDENSGYPFLAWQNYEHAPMFLAGLGTSADPFLISTARELCNVRNFLGSTHDNKYFRVVDDIDLNDYITNHPDMGADGWLPIGTNTNAFYGTLDGNGNVISNLRIKRTTDYIGLFGYLSFAKIDNIGVVANPNITGRNYAGVLCGYNNGGQISESFTKGAVFADGFAGGFVGYNDNGQITNSYSRTNVNRSSGATNTDFGGFVGHNYQGAVERCYSTGFIKFAGVSQDDNGFSGNFTTGGNYFMLGNLWDTETSESTKTACNASDKSTLEMISYGTFISAGWDFMDETANGTNYIWAINFDRNNGYPVLAWEGYAHEPLLGAGTSVDPYQIRTPTNLSNMRAFLGAGHSDKFFELMNGIILNDYLNNHPSWGTEGWLPIGHDWTDYSFQGTFRGENNTISGLWINRSGSSELGLFGMLEQATVENIVIIVEGKIEGNNNVGGLAGSVSGSTIYNCLVEGEIIGNSQVGGLIGNDILSQIENSGFRGKTSGATTIGGISGYSMLSSFSNSFSDAEVSGTSNIGGFVGFAEEESEVYSCFSLGDISGVEYVGGFIGYNVESYIYNSYSRANVLRSSGGSDRIGGFVGENDKGIINNCYSTGEVMDIDNTSLAENGFVGSLTAGSAAGMSNNFWDMTSSLNDDTAGEIDGSATGKTTAEMNSYFTFYDAGWDFRGETVNGTNELWNIGNSRNDGYPYHDWLYSGDPDPCFNPTDAGIIAEGQSICYNTTPTAFTSSSEATGQLGTLEYKWQKSTTNASEGFSDIASSNTSAYTEAASLTQSTWYKRLARVTCKADWSDAAESNVINVSVYNAFTAGEILSDGENLCHGNNPMQIGSKTSASGGDGVIEYKWQSSTTGASDGFVDIAGAVSETYTPPSSITEDTWYRRLAKDGTCNTDLEMSDGVWQVTILAEFTAGAIETAGETLCFGVAQGEIGNITAASGGDNDITYQWLSCTDGSFSDPTVIVHNQPTYTPPADLDVPTWYRRQAKDGECNTAWETSTGTWHVTPYPQFTAGAIATTGETICYEAIAATIASETDASGGDGNITYRWQSSSDNFDQNISDIADSNSETYTPPTGLTDDTWYRRQAHDGHCNTEWETSGGIWKVTVLPQFIPGEIEASTDNLCYNHFSSTILSEVDASGGDENIQYRWEYSYDEDFTAPEPVPDHQSDDAWVWYPDPLTQSKWFRRMAKDGTCNTDWELSIGVKNINVYDEISNGAIADQGETICYAAAASEILNETLASGGGSDITYRWQSCTDGTFSEPTIIEHNDPSFTPPTGLTLDTWYRRQFREEVCTTPLHRWETSTGVWKVTVRDEFTPGAIQTDGDQICAESDAEMINNDVLASGGATPITYRWISSATETFAEYIVIEHNEWRYRPSNDLTETTWFRRQAKDSQCNTEWETSEGTWQVIVYPELTPGAIETVGETICYSGTPDQIGSAEDAQGGDGNITYKWQSSTTGEPESFLDIADAVASTYTPPAGLTQDTWYRRWAIDGECNYAFLLSSGVWKVTVLPDFSAGAIETTGETICHAGTPALIGSETAASGGDGLIAYRWQSSTDNFDQDIHEITDSDAETYTPPAGLTETTWYRRQAKDGECNTVWEISGGVWKVTVLPEFTAGAIAVDGETICHAGIPAAIGSETAASGGDGLIAYRWQSSTDNFDQDIHEITDSDAETYTPPAGLTETTWYRRQAKDGECNTVWEISGGVWKVTVLPEFTAGAIETTGETISYAGTPGEIGSEAVASGGDDDITYRWQSSTDESFTSPTDIESNTASFTPPAGLTETTWFRRQAKDGLCNTEWETSTGVWKVTVLAQTFTVTYNANSTDAAGMAPDDTNEYEAGEQVTVLGQGTLDLDGYTFEGWNTQADGEGTTYKEDDTFEMPASNVTLYAFWEEIPDKEITSVASIADITVEYGTELSDLSLPTTAEVTLDDASVMNLGVTWDGGTPEYDGEEAGTYVFEGTLTLVDGVANTDNHKASVNVIVRAEEDDDEPPATYLITFSVEAGSGTLIAEVDGAEISSGDEVEEGKEIEFTATPGEGYKVKEWKLNDVVVTGHTGLTYTVEDVNDAVEVKVAFEEIVGISEIDGLDISIFPNPSRDKFIVESSEMIERIRLVNISGQVVIDTHVDELQTEINVSNLHPGLFFMQIHTTKGIVTERVQVAK